MEATYQSLAQRVLAKWEEHVKAHTSGGSTPASIPRLLIALAGPPGSGKTTVAMRVVDLVNSSPSPSAPRALAVSADGFHLPRSHLQSLPNAAEAFARRGAHWTFDGAGAVSLARALSSSPRAAVSTPTFDHAVKDPVADGLIVGTEVDVVIFEGNYLLCDEYPWSGVAPLAHDRWLVAVEEGLARRRVAARHVAAGIEPDLESGLRRADGNDMPNGRFVVEMSEGRYDLLVQSVEEAKV